MIGILTGHGVPRTPEESLVFWLAFRKSRSGKCYWSELGKSMILLKPSQENAGSWDLTLGISEQFIDIGWLTEKPDGSLRGYCGQAQMVFKETGEPSLGHWFAYWSN